MKRIAYFFMTMLACLPATIFAQVDEWDGGAVQWTQGTGTEADPYLIETAENLAWITEMVNNGLNTYEGVYFKMTTDLNLKNLQWSPIGLDATNCFKGFFDGDGHLIDSLYINSSTLTYLGLFGYVKNSTISNIRINKATVSAASYSAALVGFADVTSFSNCHLQMGSISGTQYAGGIVSFGDGICPIDNCSNGASITLSGNVVASGGICGCLNSTSTVSDCNNTGQIAATKNAGSGPDNIDVYAGGICGKAEEDNTFIDCYNCGHIESVINGNMSYSYQAALKKDGNANSGGICASGGSIYYCYNVGLISATTTTGNYSGYKRARCSGIGNANCYYCYNRGDLSIPQVPAAYTSGSVRMFGVGNHCFHCYNTGSINYEASSTNYILYGVAFAATNSYYLETCGATQGGISKTEAAMKSASFPILLNAENQVYTIDFTPNINDGYPIFDRWICRITTKEAINLHFTSATLNGVYEPQQYWSGGEADVVGFEYKEAWATNYTTVYTNVGSPASYNLPGLQSGTNYQYRMFVQKDGVTYYGNVVNFSTLQCNVTAEVQTASTGICAGDTATLTVAATSSMSEEFTYQWDNEATTTAITTTEAGTYTVTVTDGNGCTATANATITVNPLPVGTISGNTALCAGESTTLTASGANRYNWNTGASAPTITVSEGGTYVCTFTNSYNCSSTQSVEVSMFSSPVITGETAFCTGGSTTLTATGGTSYTWSTGATTPTITVSQPGTYSVTGSSVGGCTGSSSVTVVENPLPTVEISGYPVICSGIGAELTATEGSSYLWSTGETTQSITANHTGNYSVLVTDANGCSNTTSVEVGSLTSVAISGNTSICQGETATLSVEMEGEYLWSTGARTSLISVSNAGVYSVTVSLPNGCSTSATANVSVNALPVPTITGNTTFCEGETTTLTANGGISYRWSNNATVASITVGTAGLYSVTVTDAMGCTGSTYTTVAVNPLPNVSISGNTATCQGTTTTLTANGAQSYQWNTGSTDATISVGAAGNFSVTGYSAQGCANTTSTSVTIYPTYNTPISHSMCQGETYNFFGQNLTAGGTYTHTLYSTHGCDSVITLTLTVREVPVVSINGTTAFCEGQSTMLYANGGTSYQWNSGTSGSTLMVNAEGNYTVTATNAQGCTATASTYVTVYPLPNVTISGNTSTCQGNQVILTANGAQSYQWNTGSTNATIMVGTTGNFTVIGYSAQGCSNTASTSVSVYPTYNTPISQSICEGETYNFFGQNLTTAGTYTYPLYSVHGCDSIITLTLTVREVPVVSISGNTSFCQGENSTLVANGGVSYNWSTGSTGSNLYVSESGAYTVTATNAQGCSATATTYITVNELPTITISGNTEVCQGTATTLTANGAATYQWSNGTNGANNTVDVFGNYTVTGTSAAGCSSTATATVIVYSLPVINISGETEICQGSSTTLTANGAETYLWNNGTTDATLTTSNAGTYTVIGTDEHGCYSTESVDVVVYYPTDEDIYVSETGSYEWHDNTYTESGDYTWTGQTIHGCDSVVTLHLTITPTDTTGIATYDGSDITLYPNPTTGIVNVQFTMNNGQLADGEIMVFDVYGRRLQVVGISDARTSDARGASLQTAEIDLSQYATGIYLVKLVNDGKVVATGKVVKQ